MSELMLEAVDRDGAIEGAFDALPAETRRSFLLNAATGAALHATLAL